MRLVVRQMKEFGDRTIEARLYSGVKVIMDILRSPRIPFCLFHRYENVSNVKKKQVKKRHSNHARLHYIVSF